MNTSTSSSAPAFTGLLKQSVWLSSFRTGAIKQASGLENPYLDMRSNRGFLADFLTPATWGADRAGRALALADAAHSRDMEKYPRPAFSVKHPLKHGMLVTLPAAVLGGLAGHLAGSKAGLNALGTTATTVGGIGVGSALGNLLATYLRRKKMKQSVRDFNEAEPGLEPVDIHPDSRYNGVEKYTTSLFSGAHREGDTRTRKRLLEHLYNHTDPGDQRNPNTRISHAHNLFTEAAARTTPVIGVGAWGLRGLAGHVKSDKNLADMKRLYDANGLEGLV